MVHWFAKDFPVGDWAYVQDAFENIIVRLGAPEAMMLISERRADGVERLYGCFPHPDMAKAFDGFAPVGESDLPRNPSLLVGNQTVYAERFGYHKH